MGRREKSERTRLEAALAKLYKVRLINNVQAVISLLVLLLILVLAGNLVNFIRIQGLPWRFDAPAAQEMLVRMTLDNMGICFAPFFVVGSLLFWSWLFVGSVLESSERQRTSKEGRKATARRWGHAFACIATVLAAFAAFGYAAPIAGLLLCARPFAADPLCAFGFKWSLSEMLFPWGYERYDVPPYELPALTQYFDAARWIGPVGGAAVGLVYLLSLSGLGLVSIRILLRRISGKDGSKGGEEHEGGSPT